MDNQIPTQGFPIDKTDDWESRQDRARVVDRRRDFNNPDAMANRAPEALHTASDIPEPFELGKEIVECLVSPYGRRILVAEDKFQYRGRIKIPDQAKRIPTTGRILRVSAELSPEERAAFKPGCKILYGVYSGTAVQFKNRPRYRILSIEEVLGFVDTDEEIVEVGA